MFRIGAVGLAALLVAAAGVASAAAEPAASSSPRFLGEKPDDAVITKGLADDIRRISAAERVALLEITLLCELDRGALSRKRAYDPWERRCRKTEDIWNATHRTSNDSRVIDVQMRLYQARRRSLHRSALRYFMQKETIARKVKRREDVADDVKAAVRQRKDLSAKSTEILRFFFALRDLFAKSQK